MDVVITFVDGSDPLWREDFRRLLDVPVLEKRYRDWGLLRFLFRGIETHMPFVRKVFLVVARDSQVPAWVDRGKVDVVLHEQIIPAEYLPTFNSCTIEMFLHRIPGLDERYLYFNDDMFPMQDCTEEDFFPEGHPALGFARCRWARSLFKHHCRNADRLAGRAAGVAAGSGFLRPEQELPVVQQELLPGGAVPKRLTDDLRKGEDIHIDQRTLCQPDRGLQGADPKLGPLHVDEELRHDAAGARGFAAGVDQAGRLLQRGMGQVQPKAVHPLPEHRLQRFRIPAGGAEGPIDLDFTHGQNLTIVFFEQK